MNFLPLIKIQHFGIGLLALCLYLCWIRELEERVNWHVVEKHERRFLLLTIIFIIHFFAWLIWS